MKIAYIEPMLNMYNKSRDYLKPFGIKLIYKDGHSKSFCGNHRTALCASLTNKQQIYIEQLIRAIEA